MKDLFQTSGSVRSSLLFYSLLLLGGIASLYLAGGPQTGGEGLFLIAAGAGLLIFPPQIRVANLFWALGGGFLLCSGLSFLPAVVAGGQGWRRRFAGLPVDMGWHITPIPEESLFWLVIAAVSVVLILFCLTRPLRSRSLLVLATAGALTCAVYAGLAIYSFKTGWKFPFDSVPTFGFFPNRNHTASFLVTGCMLALGVLGVARNHWLAGCLAAISLATSGTALLVYSGSRGGVVFLFVGILLWLLGLGRKRWSIPLAVSVSGIFLATLMFFIVSKGEARNRLMDQFGLVKSERKAQVRMPSSSEAEGEPTLDARILIFQDTWRMIQDAPLTGVGLGAFRYVYPQYRTASLSESTSVHPESDWLMLAAEAGLPALLVAVVMMLILLRRVASQRDHAYWPLRWGVLCAVLAALAHGMVDVPIHRVALGWWVCLFAGAGLQIWPTAEAPARVWERIIFWLTGTLALAIGIWMVGSEWKGFPATPPFAAAKAQSEILRLFQAKQLETASNLASEAISRSPMAHGLYLQKGILELNYEGTENEVDGYFAAERALNPDWVQVPIQQGDAWMQVDQQRTWALWKDALARSRRLDASQGNKDNLRRTFETLLQHSAKSPNLLLSLGEWSRDQTGLTLLWLRTVPNALAAGEFENMGGEEKTVSQMSEEERVIFLRLWYEKGEQAALFAFIDTHPGWQEAAWPLKIRQMVDSKKFQNAVQAVLQHHHLDLSLAPSGTSTTLPPLDDTATPLEKFTFYWKSGNEVTARRILEEARVQAEKSGKKSPELWKTSATLAIHDQHWDAAWSWLQRYLRDSGLDASL